MHHAGVHQALLHVKEQGGTNIFIKQRNGIAARRTPFCLFSPYRVVYVPRTMCAHYELENSQIVINTDHYFWSWALSFHIHCGFGLSKEFIHSWESGLVSYNGVNICFLDTSGNLFGIYHL